MERRLFLLFLCILFLLEALCASSHDFLKLNAPGRRSLLSDAKGPKTALVAALDGTIFLLEEGSPKPLWSFSTGTEIYSSYQAPVNAMENTSGYFIDCGDDWELYAHDGRVKLKLRMSFEEYLSSTPQITEDGGVVLGSKETTAFLIDAKTGRVLHTYKTSDLPSTTQSSFSGFHNNTTAEEQYKSGSDLKADGLSLYITRTDYRFMSFMPNSDKVLWNMTAAVIGAAFLCQDVEKSISGSLPDVESSEPDLNMPLPCQSRVLVHQFHKHNMSEALSLPHGPPKALYQDKMLPASAANVLPSQPNVEKVLNFLPSSVGESQDTHKVNGGINHMHDTEVISNDGFILIHQSVGISQTLVLSSFLLVFVVYSYVVSRTKAKLALQSTGTSSTNVPAKRKKPRKAGKGGINNGKQGKEENWVQHTHNESGNNFLLNLNQPISCSTDARRIGKLVVTDKEIAKGSDGTIVLEGIYEGRPVAVKRLVRAYNDIALKEIQNLIVSDYHPNIVRWYGVEQDQDFVYIALERCDCSLNDLILVHLKSSASSLGKDLDGELTAESTICLDSVKGFMQEYELWNSDGCPSHVLLKLMRDVVSGIVHLHELGIIHRDLKPQNVLITSERSLCARLSDMGISKRLAGNMSSLSSHATGCGSSGWQAPEQLLHGRQTRAVDMFSLGCVLFFCITGGRHPFGKRLERDVNIVKNKLDLFVVEHIPEAVELFLRLLNPIAEMRPRAVEVLGHPLFWSAEVRLTFLRDTSDRVELEDRETGSDLLKSLESIAPLALGGKWNEKMEPLFLNNIGQYRRYKFDSVRDLLRVIRNKLNHYRELPAEIQELVGPVPEGFDRYFRSRFPKLLTEVYKVMILYCNEEECFSKYFNGREP